MTRTFIQTFEFEKMWKQLGLGDEELRRLELEILSNHKIGDVIQGTGKLRKMRFSFGNRGKSNSVRVCYVDFVVFDTVYLITAYAKNKKDNLTMAERNEIKKMISLLERNQG